jgi:hypothetical protein
MSRATDREIYRGQDKTYLVTVVDDAGAAIDLTGGTMFFRVSDTPGSAHLIIAKSSAVGAEITFLAQSGATLGQAEIYIVPADTSDLEADVYYYDVWFQLGSGKRYPVIPPSRFEVLPPVSSF